MVLRSSLSTRKAWVYLAVWFWCWVAPSPTEAEAERTSGPNIIIVTVDTLRFDRVSFYGYPRPTSPNIDALLEKGVSFSQARVPEPLTAPSMTSMLTSLFPHEHGTTRNGLRMRPGLASLASILKRRGYQTAAFVGNWTLKDQLSGLGEHFIDYNEVFTRKRWFGLVFGEATADDLTVEILAWIKNHQESSRRPFLAWVHYVEPHEPYRFHGEFASRLGVETRSESTASDRYDTEIAFVDAAIGDLFAGLDELPRQVDPLVVFASDHGESLGEHDYWGHGRHLYEATLRIPMGITWEGGLKAQKITAPASLLDITPTILGLVGAPVPSVFRGFDWSGVLTQGDEPPNDRVTHHQAHKGAVQGRSGPNVRRRGLLAVARVAAGQKEILRTKSKTRQHFDLSRDSEETNNLAARDSQPSEELVNWLEQVREGLVASDELPPPSLDEESLEQLRALGYID